MATAKFVLKRKLKNGEYGMYIRISHLNHPAKYLKLSLKTKMNEWNNESQRFKRNKSNYKELNESLREIETLTETIISNLELQNRFSYEAFKKAFYQDGKIETPSVKDSFIEKLKQLEASKRFGSLRTYSNCYASLSRFTSLDIQFSDIDFKFLKDFEIYHIKLGNKPNSYGGYFRILRALHYEYCKLNDIAEPGIYKRFNIARIKNETRKKSLTKSQLKSLIEHDAPSDAQQAAKMIFLFSFYGRGINLMDILQLTDKNIENGCLVYRRQKTGKQMKIKLVPEAISILEYFKNESEFLFPYLQKDDIPKYRVRDVNSNMNRRLKLVGKAIGVEGLSMYFARHTFAELHYKAGIRIEIISQMLGHSDLKTTQTYLKSFSDDEIDEAANKIFDSL